MLFESDLSDLVKLNHNVRVLCFPGPHAMNLTPASDGIVTSVARALDNTIPYFCRKIEEK